MPTNTTVRSRSSGTRSISVEPSFLTSIDLLPNELRDVDTHSGLVPQAFPWDLTSNAFDSNSYLFLKRTLDIVGAICGLIVLGPATLIAMLVVWIEDGGPVIFRQRRVGLNGKSFIIYKIRSMSKDAESRLHEVAELNQHNDHRTLKIKDDPRLLKCGKLLRKFSIDEFPQLINVLKGDMSVVGPRPSLPREVALYDSEDFARLSVKPGLTCYWQISGRGELAFKDQLSLDLRYIEDCSTLTDLSIIARTFPSVLRGSGAH